METSVVPEAAVAILHAAAPEESVLLIRRARRDGDPWSGHWSFPGGRREPGDTDLVDTALRELLEECAIVLGRESLESALEVTHAGQHTGRYIWVAPYLFRLASIADVRLHPGEAEEALWLPLSVLRDEARRVDDAVPGLPGGRKVPGIPLNGVALWGFTYRVLCDWLDIPCPRGV